jgi:hypothetical protein
MDQKVIVEALKDFRGALDQAKQEPRQYEKKSSNIYKPDNARFKLVIWFKDGNKRYFYSYDNKHFKEQVLIDEYEALLKLLRLVHKYNGTFKNAIVYTTTDKDKKTSSNFCHEVVKFDIYGNQKTNKLVNFVNLGSNVLVDIKKLEVYSNGKI